MNRRSFLGLLAGALLVKPALKATGVELKPGDRIKFHPSVAPNLDHWMPFSISDWATLQPGEIADSILFGGEQPEEFRINTIAVRVASSTSRKNTRAILGETRKQHDEYIRDGAWLELRSGEMLLIKTPLWFLSGVDSTPLPLVVPFHSVQPLSATIRTSEPVAISEPSMVFMVMHGAVRMTAEQVDRMRAAWEAEENYQESVGCLE